MSVRARRALCKHRAQVALDRGRHATEASIASMNPLKLRRSSAISIAKSQIYARQGVDIGPLPLASGLANGCMRFESPTRRQAGAI